MTNIEYAKLLTKDHTLDLRVWDIEANEMIYLDDYLYWFEENYITSIDDIGIRDRYIFMHYLGFKDANEKKVYELDIIQWYNSYEDAPDHIIAYLSDQKAGLGMNAGWYGQKYHFEKWFEINTDDFFKGQEDNISVKGNLLENPGLLNLKF